MKTIDLSNQQEVVANFYNLLHDDFTEADRLIQSDNNFGNIITFNACYDLYQQHIADKRENDREMFINRANSNK